MGPFVPFAVSRLCREMRATLGMEGDLVVVAFYPFAFSRLCAKRAARISWLFLLMDEKPLVFAGVHTRPISA